MILTHEYAPYWQDIQQVLQQFKRYKSMHINQTEVIKNFVKHGLGIAFCQEVLLRLIINRIYYIAIPYKNFLILCPIATF